METVGSKKKSSTSAYLFLKMPSERKCGLPWGKLKSSECEEYIIDYIMHSVYIYIYIHIRLHISIGKQVSNIAV